MVRKTGGTKVSDAELRVVALVAEGLTNVEIADRLAIGVSTVKAHVYQVTQRLGFRNRVQLAVWYVRAEERSPGIAARRHTVP